jgi:hypothetical protein
VNSSAARATLREEANTLRSTCARGPGGTPWCRPVDLCMRRT